MSQTEISGIIDDRFPNDKACLERIQFLMDKIGSFEKAGFNHSTEKFETPNQKDLYGILPAERSKPYESVTLVEQLRRQWRFETI